MAFALWPVPVAMLLLAVVLGVVLPKLDLALDDRLSPTVAAFVFGGGASEARQLLSSIASGLITTVSLTFSLTVIVFQLASSQYSPRLLRLFPRDAMTRATLGLLAGTYVYALTVLRTTREDAVPRFSVTLAFVATAAGVLLLVVFLGHVVKELRVETMLRRVHREHDRVVDQVLGEAGPERHRPALPEPTGERTWVLAASSGFVVALDEADLVAAGRRAGGTVEVLRGVGEHVTVGTPLARVTGSGGDDLVDGIRDAILLGYERTSAQDVGFGIQQLVDIYAKALSPGVNDPTTARNALGHLASVFAVLARRDLTDRVLADDDGTPRLVIRTPGFGVLLESGVGPVRTFGASDVVVVVEAMALLRDVAWNARTAAHRDAVAEQRDRLVAAARRGLDDDEDIACVEAAAGRVSAALQGSWD